MNYPSSPEKPLQHEPPQETGIDRRAFVRVCIAAAIALRGILSEPPVAHADEKKPDLKGSLEVVMGKLTITMKNWDSYHPDHESNTQKMIKDRMANIMPFFEASEIPLEGNVTFTYDPKLTERGILFEYRHHLHAKNIAPSEQRNSIPEWQQISASEIAFGAIDSPSMVHALTHIVFRASLQGSDLWSEGIANSMADRYQEQYPAQETAWPHDRDLSALHDTQA
ncbi:MAG: hypothetical protein U1C97_02565, partial [Candidatus Gracilibacteria bacterium]|nr:hypothetical protein [Candidatus Gracilibacteria bacterium]